MAASRAAGSGGTYQTPVPPDAVAPLVPQYPLSARTTEAPSRVALSAAHVAAGPPPTTRTSVVSSRVMAQAPAGTRQDVNLRSRATSSWLNTTPMAEIVMMPAYICGIAKLNWALLIR